jgi:hypothetical protein
MVSDWMTYLQIDLKKLEEWDFRNEMKINPTKSKAVYFTKDRVTEPLNSLLRNIAIPKANSCKYLGIILCNDLSWDNHVNYTVK